MKKLTLLLIIVTLFLSVKGQDSSYVYQERGMIRLDNVEASSIFFVPNQLTYRLRGSNIILKDGLTNKEYNIGSYAYIFDEDTTGFANNDAVFYYLNGFISNFVNRDAITDATNAINYEHHEIHSGSHYYVCGDSTIDTSDTLEVQITTSNTAKWIHLVYEFQSTQQTAFHIYETATVTADGDAVTALNNNRNSTNTTSLTLFQTGGTVTVDGTLIYSQLTGVSGNLVQSRQGIAGRNNEIILKQNTTYRFLFISSGDNNTLSYCAEWYEHTNR